MKGRQARPNWWYQYGMTLKRVRFVTTVMVTLLLLVCAGACAYHLHVSHQTARPGDRFPDLTVTSLDGREGVLPMPDHGEYIVNVFATWCGPCIQEMPDYNRTAETLARRGITTIGIAQGQDPETVGVFARQMRIGFPVVADTRSLTRRMLGARIIPETLIVRNGVISRAVEGPISGTALAAMALAQ